MIQEGLREIFRRKPGRYDSIDGIRALAVLWVIAFHTLFVWGDSVSSSHYESIVHSSWNWFWTKGYIAINPFFVISGFLIGDLLLREYDRTSDLRLRSFYIRRFFRLAPAYYLLLAGIAVYGWFTPTASFSLDALWTNFFYINNWFPHRDQPALWAWSLAVEEQFYILCPLLILALMRKRLPAGRTILGLVALSIAWNYYIAATKGPFKVIYRPTDDLDAYYRFFDFTYAQTLTRASALLMGVGCAYLKRSSKAMERLKSNSAVALMTFFFFSINFAFLNPASLPPGGSESSPIMTAILNPLSAFSFACLVMLIQTGRGFGRIADRLLGSAFWFPVAQISYGLYLIHCVVVDYYYRFFPPPSEITQVRLLLNFVVVFLVSAVLSVALSVFVETPMRKLGYRLAKGTA